MYRVPKVWDVSCSHCSVKLHLDCHAPYLRLATLSRVPLVSLAPTYSALLASPERPTFCTRSTVELVTAPMVGAAARTVESYGERSRT